MTKGAEHVATYAKTAMSERQYCRLCGGHLMARHPPLNMVDGFAATIPDLRFVPQVPRQLCGNRAAKRDRLPN